MDILRTTTYDRFRCAGSACEETCCRGWKVLVDEKTLSFFRSRKGLERLRLSIPVTDKKKDPVLDITAHRCFFLTRERLCYLQKTYGEAHMPSVCRVYPRERTNCGILSFESLDLACIEAARLFLTNDAPAWSLVNDEVSYEKGTTNEDEEYLLSLVTEYSHLAEEAAVIFEPEDLEDFLQTVSKRAFTAQQNVINGIDPFAQEEDETDMPDDGKNILPLPMNEINLLVNTCLYHEDVKRRSPYLYKLLKQYFKRFDRLREHEGAPVLKKLFEKELDKREDGAAKYARYFAMHMLRACPSLYEDYSFYRKVREALMHMNMIVLFDALTRHANGGILTTDEEAHIIAVYEKRAFHSPGLLNKMYNIINHYESNGEITQ